MDSSQLIPAKDRKLANSVRTVEDPIVTKAKALKVRKCSIHLALCPSVRKIYPYNGRRIWPRLGRHPARAEDFTFIVTLRRSHYSSLLLQVFYIEQQANVTGIDKTGYCWRKVVQHAQNCGNS